MRTAKKAVVIERPGPPEVLTIQERPVPRPLKIDLTMLSPVSPWGLCLETGAVGADASGT